MKRDQGIYAMKERHGGRDRAACGGRRFTLSRLSISSGFTLIELMVAITLMALMVGILYGAFYLSHRSVEKAQVRFEKNYTLRAVEEFLGGLIRSAYPYRSDGGEAVLFTGATGTLTFVSSVSMGIEGRGASKVTLSWNPGAESDLILEGELPVRGAGYSNSVVLWRRVSDLKLEYLEPQGAEDEWVGDWDGESKRDLPRAVRMTLLDDFGKQRRWVFPIMMKVLAPS